MPLDKYDDALQESRAEKMWLVLDFVHYGYVGLLHGLYLIVRVAFAFYFQVILVNGMDFTPGEGVVVWWKSFLEGDPTIDTTKITERKGMNQVRIV